jgi:P27 family predicted phage terminase small subunit
MGKRGPAPQPTALKLVRGETRPSRVNKNEPKPPLAAKVEPPEYLDEEALDVWAQLAPSMIARGVLTAWDVNQFAAYCAAVVHHRRAVKIVNLQGVMRLGGGEDAVEVKHPAMQIVRDQAQLMVTLGGRFGLTPSDRSSISLEPEEPHGHQGAAQAILD